jgi:hypothetical protein
MTMMAAIVMIVAANAGMNADAANMNSDANIGAGCRCAQANAKIEARSDFMEVSFVEVRCKLSALSDLSNAARSQRTVAAAAGFLICREPPLVDFDQSNRPYSTWRTSPVRLLIRTASSPYRTQT